jgi:hypothetical protein
VTEDDGVGDGPVAMQAETHRHAAALDAFELRALDDAPPARLDGLEHALGVVAVLAEAGVDGDRAGAVHAHGITQE